MRGQTRLQEEAERGSWEKQKEVLLRRVRWLGGLRKKEEMGVLGRED